LTASGLDARATPGQKSQFDVIADGRLVFSKQQSGRWPESGEVERLLAERA